MRYTVVFGLLLAFGCRSVQNLSGDADLPTKIAIDLTAVNEDRVPVVIEPNNKISEDTLIFRMPKVVQGTYAISDFGRFVEEIKALNAEGQIMEVIQKDDNTWFIPNAEHFDKLTYFVNDTYDLEGEGAEMPFSPSGTNIDPEAYVLNLHGFIGYFEGQTTDYEINVKSPAGMERTSALPLLGINYNADSSVRTDRYLAERYFEVTDNPMFYGNLDIEEFMVGDIKIVLSVYSPNGIHKAAEIKSGMEEMMAAQKAYLGDINSTERYDIILYLSSGGPGSPQGFGALEHHTSTVVVLPEMMNKEFLEESMTDVVSHEFFHIVTPLTVHSEDIHYFDYYEPTFSKHLWMYEGLTEYFANHFQIVEELISEEDFYARMTDKIGVSRGMQDDMSFTEMSENILEEPYKSNYLNVYNKGALIGMCLDLIINQESGGERDLMSVMKALAQKYGKNKPFEDDNIIAEITAMTYPSVGDFFEKHVQGGTPIDYNEFLNMAGLTLSEGKKETSFLTNGNALIIGGDPAVGLFFNEAVLDNSFWADQGVLPNDVIKTWNGEAVTLSNAQQVLGKAINWQPGDSIQVVLMRDAEEITIDAVLVQSYTSGTVITPADPSSAEQLAIREKWLSR